MKTCSKCKKEKELAEFYKDKGKKDGLKSWCKECHLEDSRKRESKYNETRRKYREEHQEEYRKKKREYYKENKEKILESNKQWRQTFNGRLLSYKRSAEQRGIEWLLTESEFESFWNKPCSYCGGDIETVGIDRIDSQGSYEIGNCKSCCTDCNKMKLDLSEDEFLKLIKKIHNNLKL